jgi:hypothetical protein
MGASTVAPLSELLKRFWSAWQWERGDGECDALRRSLAAELVRLAERKAIVPTLDLDRPISLGFAPCFYFSELPDDFRTAIVAAGVTITAGGHPATALATSKVVLEGFATAYRRACDYAGRKPAPSLAGIGWPETAAAFRERPWFAEQPGLLECLASCLNDEQSRKAGEWVKSCRVLAEAGDGSSVFLPPCELLAADFPGKQHLPRRFLHCVSATYREAAVKLLQLSGLRPQPLAADLIEWATAKDTTGQEAVGILRYLGEENRFMAYPALGEVFRSSWFPLSGKRVSIKEAVAARLIPEEILRDEVFRAWLGLSDREEEPVEQPQPPPDAKEVLAKLFAWWQKNGAAWTKAYERRLYPAGQPPALRDAFYPTDSGDRRAWITLLLLASMHTLGRTQLEQHRNFLSRCDERGWLDVFADGEYDARRWMNVLENYLEDPAGKHDYYQWMKQFVVMFQISRWLPEYVDSFLSVNRVKGPFGLDQIIAPRTNASFSGGGPDAPALTRALGFGACFVLRELTRAGTLKQTFAHQHCYVPTGRVCSLLAAIGCENLEAEPAVGRSRAIHRFLLEHMGPERAPFELGFDLPLLALSEDVELQRELCGNPLSLDGDGNSTGSDEGWRTLPDGRRIKLW